MSKQQILIVEDEPNLGTTLSEYLSDKGHDCRLATSCEHAISTFDDLEFNPTVILMDIGLPDGNGLELARTFRAKKQDFVLLFLSALNDPETKLEGLDMGAEDYITKPFDLRELTLRLERAVKIHGLLDNYSDEITMGSLKVKFKSYEAIDSNGNTVPLGQKECAILELLYSKKNEVVSRDLIIDKIWGEDAFPTNRTVDNYIVKLRKWIETDKTGNVSIKSVRGVGYQLILK